MVNPFKQKLQVLMADQHQFSIDTFGPEYKGGLDHLIKEFEEVKAEPSDITEWADCLLLAVDCGMRCVNIEPKSFANSFFAILSEESPEDVKGSWKSFEQGLTNVKQYPTLWYPYVELASRIIHAGETIGQFSQIELIQAMRDKLEINKKRIWPDWREREDLTQAIEHVEN